MAQYQARNIREERGTVRCICLVEVYEWLPGLTLNQPLVVV